MEVETAGKDIGAGKPFERELGAVCTAADGNYLGFYTGILHGLQSDVDDVHHRFDFLAHVVILVLDLEGGHAGEFVVDFACEVFKLFFAALEAVAVVVADYIGESGFLYSSLNGYKMIETFVAFGVLGSFPAGEHYGKLGGDAQ